MTACRNKASRAVTAALVGVLSVGAVPMVAMAATSGAVTLATTESDFAAGSVTYEGGLAAGATFAWTGSAQGLVPEYLTTKSGDQVQLEFTKTQNLYELTKETYYYTYVKVDASDVSDDGTIDTEEVRLVETFGG